MRHMRRAALAALMALALCGCDQESGASSAAGPITTQATALPQGKGFDFYVLALSWSPSYCEAEGSANRQQCGSDADHGFVVHGLWPQFERGYPEHCASREPERVPDRLVQRYLDLMPSAGLIGHQWRKHGSCSGLSQEDYFAVMRAAAETVRIPASFASVTSGKKVDPDAVEQAFLAANAGLTASALAVTCQAGFVRDVRVCLTPDLGFRDCREIDRSACRASSVRMPAP